MLGPVLVPEEESHDCEVQHRVAQELEALVADFVLQRAMSEGLSIARIVISIRARGREEGWCV